MIVPPGRGNFCPGESELFPRRSRAEQLGTGSADVAENTLRTANRASTLISIIRFDHIQLFNPSLQQS
jgi:hypothetical protein